MILALQKKTPAALWERFLRTRGVEDRNALAELYLPLVTSTARRFARESARSVDVDDLIQIGSIGLIGALDNFNPSLSDFESHARFKVGMAIRRSFALKANTPRSLFTAGGRVTSFDTEAADDCRTLLDTLDEDDPLTGANGVTAEESVEALLRTLGDQDWAIMRLIYRQVYSIRHVAELLETTWPIVKRRHDEIIHRLAAQHGKPSVADAGQVGKARSA